MRSSQTVLISGAGIAGLILAYWLKRYGYSPVVVEQASELRTGGHPVDLWGAAAGVAARMGIRQAVEAARTQNDTGVTITKNEPPVEFKLSSLEMKVADDHVEIMRGELVTILYQQVKGEVEFMFSNSIVAMEEFTDGVQVKFQHGQGRKFDLVIGADGQHSNVRRLVFGNESAFSRYLGGYISGFSMPNYLSLHGSILRYIVPDKTVAVFPVRQRNEIGVGFLFRSDAPLNVHYNDVEKQKQVLHDTFAREGWEIDRLLEGVHAAENFYFDSFTQIRMDTWSRGRVTLVGDAGYGSAPGIGGGTSLAAIAAYILAGEMITAQHDFQRGFQAYEEKIRDAVIRSRDIGPAFLKTLVPRSSLVISLGNKLMPLLMRLPKPLQRWLPLLPKRGVEGLRTIASLPLQDYPRERHINIHR